MKPEAREKFLTWHQEQVESNYVFDFQHEILKYCRSDVDILAQCCKLYREMFMQVTDTTHDETGLDPFDSAITIAAYCMQVYRTKFLKKDTIALFPQHQELKRKTISRSPSMVIVYGRERRDTYPTPQKWWRETCRSLLPGRVL